MRTCIWTLLALIALQSALYAQKMTREEKVRADREKVESEGFWIYNDLQRGYELARETGKPLVVVLRCIPCEECVKLDDDLVDTDPVIRPLLEQFVCVRIVGTNGLDLNTFQYDTDQSFAMFMLNADKEIYGRFGTRSHRTDWVGDVSLEGMAAALEGALALHKQYPANKDSLKAKRGEPLEFASPELYPSLKEKFSSSLNYEGKVVESCIHCHQIGDARRDLYWQQSQPVPEKLMYPYPHPKSVGLILDPKHRATVKSVVDASVADAAGLMPGDEILRMNTQPLLSMADVQWVLNDVAPEGGSVQLLVRRNGQMINTTLELQDGWRRKDDTTWRVATWGKRRIALGGMRLEPLSASDKASRDIVGGMALNVNSVGKYGAHAAAKNAGVRADDVLVEYDGRTDLATEPELFSYVNENLKPGDRVKVKLLRNGREITVNIPIQE